MKDNFDIYEWRLKQAMNEAVPFNKVKSDLNDDGILSPYEKKRGMAIAKNMDEQPAKMHHDATDLEEKLYEDDWMQSDDEADMAYSQLSNIKRLSIGLCDMIDQYLKKNKLRVKIYPIKLIFRKKLSFLSKSS